MLIIWIDALYLFLSCMSFALLYFVSLDMNVRSRFACSHDLHSRADSRVCQIENRTFCMIGGGAITVE